MLITGGAGFVGSFLAETLIEEGYQVRVFDNLDPQVHQAAKLNSAGFTKEIEFIWGDVRNYAQLKAWWEMDFKVNSKNHSNPG